MARIRPIWGALVLLLALFVGLCTVFAVVVTAVQAWQENGRAHWPEVTAHVVRCDLALYTRKPESYRIDCVVSYPLPEDEVVAHVRSRSTPAPRRVIWQYPPNQFQAMQAWVDRHPRGTPIAVHHDPGNPRQAALVTTDMPLGGPQTPDNLRLSAVSAVVCLVLLAIARILRARLTAPRSG